MSTITFGPPVMIDGPLPVAPPRSLLKVPGVLQENTGDLRWMNGGAVWGYPEGLPQTWDPCYTGTFETKTDAYAAATPDFAAFVIYLPVVCSSFSLAHDPEGFGMRAEVALDAIASYAIEEALSQGVPMSANPFLADANVTFPAGAGAVSVAAGRSYLEEAIGATARGGMIHLTPGAGSAFFENDGRDPGPLYTALGTPVAVGGGYAGATPSGQGAAAAGQSWVYATGPVRAWLADEAMLNIKDVLDRSNNEVTFRAERYALVEWDTALQAAVLIDWTP
jgi:hypothetical protein